MLYGQSSTLACAVRLFTHHCLIVASSEGGVVVSHVFSQVTP